MAVSKIAVAEPKTACWVWVAAAELNMGAVVAACATATGWVRTGVIMCGSVGVALGVLVIDGVKVIDGVAVTIMTTGVSVTGSGVAVTIITTWVLVRLGARPTG